ncbi:hypothetical protein [Arthrobacter oryzae]|uniref:hypothetical protein n=1 Tax=Arthrobacter oryzae TaxID=409290 RepID=UPI0028564CA3|nr:hypothetical protein [Arthrobacter oryzae]MDR6507084.1 hypothetical protein [Arthrobacter oryzae]
MGEVRSDPHLNIFEISGLAWATTVNKAAAVLAAEPGGFASAADVLAAGAAGELSPEDTRMVDTELARAGIVDAAGNISAQWVLAVWTSAFAPIKVTTVSQAGLESSHCELGLAGGRGVAVSYRRRLSRTTTLGAEVAEVRNAVEISFFRAENAWAAAARSLPAMAELHAAPSEDTGFDGERTTLPLAADACSPTAVTDGVPAAIAHARCTVRLGVAASDPGSGRTRYSAAVWALADRLYSLRTEPGTENLSAVHVPAGDVGRDFAWRILGAREFLASSSAQAA